MASQAEATRLYPTFADVTLSDANCSQRDEHSPALQDGTHRLSYRELRGAVRAIARELQARGIDNGDHVVLIGPHTATQVAAILAVGLAGGVFIPLDPTLPDDQLRALVAHARPRLTLAPALLRERLGLPTASGFLSWKEAEQSLRAGAQDPSPPEVRPTRAIRPDDVAYIMYAAGNAGQPKGAQIEHRALRTFFETYNRSAQITPEARCFSMGPCHSDACLQDVFLPLYFGATVCLSSYLPTTSSLLLHELSSQRISHFYAAGKLLTHITQDGSPLDRYDLHAMRVLQTGAEASSPIVVNRWLERLPELRFINAYGASEVTVSCIQFTKPAPGLLAGEHCPIGTPHAGTSALLLDAQGREIRAPWMVGELLLGGAQLMRGYWNAPEITRHAFVEWSGTRYYRSGDLAYRDAEGLYWFVRRNDEQVKVVDRHVSLALRELRRRQPGAGNPLSRGVDPKPLRTGARVSIGVLRDYALRHQPSRLTKGMT